jgi:tetratricopeptide (TPR) repeat protein
MFTMKIYKVLLGLTLLVMVFIPNPAYAESQSEAFNRSGNTYVAQGHYDLAITNYTKAIALNPQYADAYYNSGLAYYLKGQYDVAITNYNKAIELNSQYAYAYYGKGNALSRLGKNKEAKVCFNKFLQYAIPGDKLIEKAKQQIRDLGGTI